ncbi:hypothetical protein B7486_48840 [cyanobacterium TDX16]|nr:hypothetical protein B7486_48840 [cyanobacterium TDX16]
MDRGDYELTDCYAVKTRYVHNCSCCELLSGGCVFVCAKHHRLEFLWVKLNQLLTDRLEFAPILKVLLTWQLKIGQVFIRLRDKTLLQLEGTKRPALSLQAALIARCFQAKLVKRQARKFPHDRYENATTVSWGG